jgi:hypothetical protein
VIEIGGTVEKFYFADRLDSGDDLVNDFGSARVGKIGYTFNKLGHGGSIFGFGFVIT